MSKEKSNIAPWVALNYVIAHWAEAL